MAEDSLHGSFFKTALHHFAAGRVAKGVRVHTIDLTLLHQGPELCGYVSLVQFRTSLGRYQPLAPAVHHPEGDDLVNGVKNWDDAVFARFRFFTALHVVLFQVHVLAAHGKQLIDAHAGIEKHHGDLRCLTKALVVLVGADPGDLVRRKGALCFSGCGRKVKELGIVLVYDVLGHCPLT